MKNTFVFLLLFSSCIVFSQKEASIWYFGVNAGLDFNSGAPIALTNGQLATSEGSASISDREGNLLFYTDGTTVYNKKHEIMLNGQGLMGNYSSTNSAIIVPDPASPSKYYIFTADDVFGEDGMNYSKVDMTLDSNLGAITLKNVPLEPLIAEKLTAIKIPGEIAYWVVAHRAHTNEFLAYKITSAGINTSPVVSAVGPVITWPTGNSQGQMKISPDGKKLAVGIQASSFELYDFNSNTGAVSNYRQLRIGPTSYGLEFSPDSNLLYTSATNEGVIQYNLNAGSLQDIIATRVTIRQNELVWQMQLGIDGKIYIATGHNQVNRGGYLDVIHSPNTLGIGANYKIADLYLGGKTSTLGLPPFIQSYFYISGITAENSCLGQKTFFSVSTNSEIDQISWDFGDGNFSHLVSPEHLYAQPGSYTVTVNITSEGESAKETKEITIYENPVAHAVKNVSICASKGNFDFDLTSIDHEVLNTQAPNLFKIQYFSSQEDAEKNMDELPPLINQSSDVSEPLYARISHKNSEACYDLVKFNINISEEAIINPAEDWEVCSPSGNFNFIFSEKDAEILGNPDSAKFEVLYFASEQNALQKKEQLSSLMLSENINSPAEVFFRIQNIENPNCFKTGKFKIGVYSGIPINNSLTFAACNEAEGFGEFDTSLWKDRIFTGNDENIEFSFFNFNGESLDIQANGAYRNKTPFSETIKVEIRDKDKPGCIAKTDISLLINLMPQWTLPENYTICGLQPFLEIDGPPGYHTWEWKFEDKTIATTSQVQLKEEGTYSFRGTKTANGISCEELYYLHLQRSELPQITKVDFEDWSQSNYIEIHATGEGEFEYSIDGINFTDSNYFGNLRGGLYTVFVRDKGGCGVDTKEVVLLDFPKFFSPNNDGYNDLWQIEGVKNYSNAVVVIFDRYGKIIRQIESNEKGWDGTYNGKLMPSDDYWFSLELENGKTYKNHFSLLR